MTVRLSLLEIFGQFVIRKEHVEGARVIVLHRLSFFVDIWNLMIPWLDDLDSVPRYQADGWVVLIPYIVIAFCGYCYPFAGYMDNA